MAGKNVNWTKVDKLVDATMAAGLTSLGNDIRRRAVVLAPKLTGALRQSARSDFTTTKGDEIFISFNTPYARRRHRENNLHPSTKYYLTNALKSIKATKKYFKRFN